jgi:glutathione S-transferase
MGFVGSMIGRGLPATVGRCYAHRVPMTALTLVGRSSSHFTRTARLFALELGVAHEFRPVLDMTTLDIQSYADNPLLKVPILLDEQGPLYGTDNICRALAHRSGHAAEVVLRGQLSSRIVANAEELVVGAMSAGVVLITAGSGSAPSPKLMRSIENSLSYLDQHLDALLAALPAARTLSFVEAALFCLLEHLPFRKLRSVDDWPKLVAFAARFAERDSARQTTYRFDAA